MVKNPNPNRASGTSPTPDFVVEGGGSLYVLRALTQDARDWVSANISTEGFNPQLPHVVYIEHRYIHDIVAGIQADGFSIR